MLNNVDLVTLLVAKSALIQPRTDLPKCRWPVYQYTGTCTPRTGISYTKMQTWKNALYCVGAIAAVCVVRLKISTRLEVSSFLSRRRSQILASMHPPCPRQSRTTSKQLQFQLSFHSSPLSSRGRGIPNSLSRSARLSVRLVFPVWSAECVFFAFAFWPRLVKKQVET